MRHRRCGFSWCVTASGGVQVKADKLAVFAAPESNGAGRNNTAGYRHAVLVAAGRQTGWLDSDEQVR